MKTTREKVVIVGAGMAGLTSAAYLAKEDYEVVILEQLDRVGGLVSTFERDGFSFDTGPRAFVNSGMVKPILRDLGIEWEELRNDISIAIEDQFLTVKSLESIDEYETILKMLYPETKLEIEQIIKVVKKLSNHTKVLYEFDNPYFVDYTSNIKVLFKDFLPWLFRLLFSLKAFDKYGMAADEFLEKITDNQSLVDIILQLFFAKTPTYFALGYFQVYLDYFYLKGGTGSLPKLLEEVVLSEGAEIILNTKVLKVDVNKKTVYDESGNEFEYDHLIWASDLKTLYRLSDISGLEEKILANIKKTSKFVEEGKTADSTYIMFFGVDKSPTFFKEKSGEHFFYSPSRKGLGDVITSRKQEIISSTSLSKEEVVCWTKDFCESNSFEVSIPVLRDPELAPEGKTGVMISCLLDYELVAKFEEMGHLEVFKNTMESEVVRLFSEGIFDGFKEDILFAFSTTPLTISKIIGSTNGSIVGWSFEAQPPVYNRLKELAKSVYTPLPDVYMAGQWAYAPAGVPIAMLTAWHATRKIIEKK